MKVLIRIYKEARDYWGYIIFSAITLLMVTGTSLVIPGLMQSMVAVLENDGDIYTSLQEISRIAIVLFGFYVAQTILRFLNSYICHYAAWRFVADIRTKIYTHFQKLPLSYYHDKQTGQLMSRVVNDTHSFEILIAHTVPDLASAVILFIGVTIILFHTNVTLALLTFIPIPFILMVAPFIKKIKAQHREAQKHLAELNATLQDNFSGIKEIQIFNRQEYESDRVRDYSTRYSSKLTKALLYSAIVHPSINFLTSMGNVIVVGIGGYLALTGTDLSISQIVGFLMYLSMFYGPVSSLARISEDMQAGLVGGERVFEILDTEPDISDKENAVDVPFLNGEISFENVSFSYNKDTVVLNNVSFNIQPKKMIALVGPTGVGKTTLSTLLPRFYSPTDGTIRIDGIDIADMTLESLRKNISMVLQDVFLFNATLKENIMYGNPTATFEEVIDASKAACIHDYINSLPEGYDTIVGERGVRLSGGQKQRISIARSILCKSSILILDEATSAVDTETESQIQLAIQKLAGSRTMLVIAHRLSTVKKADCIFVFQDGKIAERGNHDELLAQEGLYKQLVDAQAIKE